MGPSKRVLALAAPLVFLAVSAVVACSDGPTFIVVPAVPDASPTADTGTTPDTSTPPSGPRDGGTDTGTPPPDPNDPKEVCAKVSATVPTGVSAPPEVFGPNMIGCPGKLRYETRVVPGACGTGWVVCSAEQVKARPVNAVINPKYHYWLNPRLWASPGGGTGRCYAAPATGNPTPTNCGNNTTGSMHFCSKFRVTAVSRYNVADDLGNTCGQVNCDYDPRTFTGDTPVGNSEVTVGDFGGCANDETAGVLCCKIP